MTQKKQLSADELALRDFFAGQAMGGMVSRSRSPGLYHNDIARDAYVMADAMMDARLAGMGEEVESDDGWGEWVDHHGGECPIPGAQAGEFQLRFGDNEECGSIQDANRYSWQHLNEFVDANIIAYRLRKEVVSNVVQ